MATISAMMPPAEKSSFLARGAGGAEGFDDESAVKFMISPLLAGRPVRRTANRLDAGWQGQAGSGHAVAVNCL
ncbi:MAG: hypothetical protein IT512_13305 [Rhodocyclaceae bacterium]|nr:hypothetical protein [Rhodocyclaceae bacterium]